MAKPYVSLYCLKDIKLPFKIVPKARPRVTENGTYNPKRYTSSKKNVALMVTQRLTLHREAIGRTLGMAWPKGNSYGIDLSVFLHSPTGGDVDGLVGNVMDACEGLLWMNDRQVVRVCVTKCIIPASEKPYAMMSVCLYQGTGFEAKAPTRAKNGLTRQRETNRKLKAAAEAKSRGTRTMTVQEYRAAIEKKNARVRRSKLVVRPGDIAKRNRKQSLGRGKNLQG